MVKFSMLWGFYGQINLRIFLFYIIVIQRKCTQSDEEVEAKLQ